jgi:hypothetical protein
MFDGAGFQKPLDEEVFKRWLENGRSSKMGYHYLLIVWDDYEAAYQPVYIEHRDSISAYKSSGSREKLVAAYDLYSETKIV